MNLKKVVGGLLLSGFISYPNNTQEPNKQGYSGMEKDFGAYHTFEEVEKEIFSLKEKYPDLVTIEIIGSSWQKNPIYAVTVSDRDKLKKDGSREEQIIIQSSMHSRELIPVEVTLKMMDALLKDYSKSEYKKGLVDNREIIFIPVFNPDGLKKFEEIIEKEGRSTWRSWRKNCRDNNLDGKIEEYVDGVDLNRNFSVNFSGIGSDNVTNSPVYHGPKEGIDNDGDGKTDEDLLDYKDNDGDGLIVEDTAGGFTEPETIAFKNFVEGLENLVSFLDLHSCSGLILWPNGFTKEKTKDDDIFSYVGKAMADLQNEPYTIGTIYTTIYPVSGDVCDWLYHEKNVLAITFEIYTCGEDSKYEDGILGDFNPKQENIDKHFYNNYGAILYFIDIAEKPKLK